MELNWNGKPSRWNPWILNFVEIFAEYFMGKKKKIGAFVFPGR